MSWKNQLDYFNTTKNVNVDFFLPELSAMKKLMWRYHVGKSTQTKNGSILGRYILTSSRICI